MHQLGSGPSLGVDARAVAVAGRGCRVACSMLTSSSRRRCSFCSSMRFWRSASSCRLCSSFSRCCCSSCCRRKASERSLLASWSLRKSRRSVDSPGRFRMELWAGKSNQDPAWGRGHCYCGSWGSRARAQAPGFSISLIIFPQNGGLGKREACSASS